MVDYIPRSFGTHDGSFHADEVTACAFLILYDLIDKDKIIRTRDSLVLDKCEFVCDVGGEYVHENKRFDHHQKEYQGFLSSAGMILKYLKQSKIMDGATYNYFNRCLVKGVDAIDNGRLNLPLGTASYSSVIACFGPTRYTESEQVFDTGFHRALEFSLGHLERLLEKHRYIKECRSSVKEVMKQGKDALIFSEAMPWMESFFSLGGKSHPAKFVVMPAGEHWKLRGIPPNAEKKMKVRLDLPITWAGLSDKELLQASGVEGGVFCHKGRFISIWETKEQVLKALELALRKGKK
ncbi:hypothetical protein COB21_01255 [Candidatus Aerophobetes bacterium]|uniref:MYG1 family protein n=1 Tax=Aerophobetes bacterium TaxID=2030807 RepID=A0A2A4X6J6_UNCAE|nr:MAG: hypothetical protein COB21_01255 [Candidatus Aerophobetes bacterium]